MFISKVSSSFLFLERYRFILLAKTNISTTRLAQSAERQPFKLVVEGSSPSSGVRMGWRVVKSDSLKSCSFGFAGSNPASCKGHIV